MSHRKKLALAIILGLIFGLVIIYAIGCTNLYPEGSPQREREREFFQHHIENIR